MKTVFLLALASARQRSSIHALTVAAGRCVFSRGNTQRQLAVSLLPEPGFLAKNQLLSQALQWISTMGIAHLNPSRAERMLCPVRQLKLYWNRNIKDITRSHISRWIMETVKEAYTQADREYDRVTAHEVRALSASWAYNCQVALPDILSGVLEVIRSLPEFLSTRHGLYRWWDVYAGSSGGRTTSRGSRTSSPTSIACTIFMQPLLRCS